MYDDYILQQQRHAKANEDELMEAAVQFENVNGMRESSPVDESTTQKPHESEQCEAEQAATGQSKTKVTTQSSSEVQANKFRAENKVQAKELLGDSAKVSERSPPSAAATQSNDNDASPPTPIAAPQVSSVGQQSQANDDASPTGGGVVKCNSEQRIYKRTDGDSQPSTMAPPSKRRKRRADNGIRKRVTKRWRPDVAAAAANKMEMRRTKLDLSDDNTFIQEYNAFISKIPEAMHQRADCLLRKFEKYCRTDDSGDLPPMPMNDALHFRVISAATKRCDVSLYQVVPHAVPGGIPKAVQEGIASIPATLKVTLAHVILVQGMYEQSPLYAECSGFERLVMLYIRLLARNEGIENKIEVLQILNTYFARLFGTNDVLDDRVERKSELRVKERERRKLNDKTKKKKDDDDDFRDFSSSSITSDEEEEEEDDDNYGGRHLNKKERRRLKWISSKKQLKRLQRRQQVARDLAARNKREREDRVRMLADRAKQRRVNGPTYVTLDRAVLAHCFDPDSGNVVCFTPVGRKGGSCRRVERSRMAHCANPNVGEVHYVYQLNGRLEFTYAAVHAMFNGLFSSDEHWLNPLLQMLPDEGYASTFKALYRKMCVFAADNRCYMHMFWDWMAPSVNASIERASEMMDQQQSAVVAPSTPTEKIIANMTTKQVGCTFAAIAVHGAESYDACKETLLSKQHMADPIIRRKHWEAVNKQFAPLLKRVNTYISYLCNRILNAQVELQDIANFGSMLLGGSRRRS
ncbi:hypothetical protein V5799_006429 [Amblyomma americanum]|uniref:Uncharacterized protein n=1 Tax=Amblyomma americanum TaxID=6943 RepID=A0AAQ4DWF1_AMBAM